MYAILLVCVCVCNKVVTKLQLLIIALCESQQLVIGLYELQQLFIALCEWNIKHFCSFNLFKKTSDLNLLFCTLIHIYHVHLFIIKSVKGGNTSCDSAIKIPSPTCVFCKVFCFSWIVTCGSASFLTDSSMGFNSTFISSKVSGLSF